MTQAGLSVVQCLLRSSRRGQGVCVLGCEFSRITFCEHRNKWFDLAEAILSGTSQHERGPSLASVIPVDKSLLCLGQSRTGDTVGDF